jgi:radical SAM protein with 4Fe4S-binding SPASM domain
MSRPKVYSVAVEVTAHCNQKCDYCYNEWREDGGAGVGQGAIDVLVARVRRLMDAFEIDHFTVTGGEPFARKDIFKLFDAMKGTGVQIISNGGLVTDDIAARLAPYGPRYVQVTLNGPDAALHEEHVGRGHFEATLRGVRALRAHGVPVVGCVVVTRKNAARLGETLSLWRSLGVAHIALSRFSPAGYASRYVAALLPSRGDMRTAFTQALPFARAEMTIHCTMPVPPCAVEVEDFEPIKFGTCPIGTSMQELALGPDGRLRNCTLHTSAVSGDVLDVDLAQALNAPGITEYRKRLPEFCQGCLHASTCGGGCGAASEWVLGDARGTPDPLVWQHIDDGFAARLEDGRRHLEVIA